MCSQPQISPVAWANPEMPCPHWVGYLTRESLPAGLTWSGSGDVPPIGARVRVEMSRLGRATVRAYFHAEGGLGVLAQLDALPAWFEPRGSGVELGYFFGRELAPYQRLAGPGAGPAPTTPFDDEDAGHDEWPDDYNQDRADYPEHPGDEQRDDYSPADYGGPETQDAASPGGYY